MTNPVTKEQLQELARLEASNRQLDLDIIQRKVRHLIIPMEQRLASNIEKAKKMRENLLAQQAEYVKEHGKEAANEFVEVRQSNGWKYDENALIESFTSDLDTYENLLRVKTTYELDKAKVKEYLTHLNGDQLDELGARWEEGFTTKFRPLGDLE